MGRLSDVELLGTLVRTRMSDADIAAMMGRSVRWVGTERMALERAASRWRINAEKEVRAAEVLEAVGLMEPGSAMQLRIDRMAEARQPDSPTARQPDSPTAISARDETTPATKFRAWVREDLMLFDPNRDAKLVERCLAAGGFPRAAFLAGRTVLIGPDGGVWRPVAEG